MNEQTKAASSAQTPSRPGSSSAVSGPAQPKPAKTNYKLLFGLIGGVVLIVALLTLVVVLLYSNPVSTAVIRDIFIIALAFTSFLIGMLMLVLIFQLQSLIALLRNEIKPMLTNANETVNTVRGTAVFVSDNLVRPTINLASFVAGLQGVQQAVMGKVKPSAKRTTGTGNKGRTS
ncbi:MAG TPA: hypothetical protein VGK87_04540 [Anaerolineae bacterium]|jgi:hypothetical protein